MPVARRLPNFELLLDDLAIRLRCLTPASALQARSHQFFGIGNEPQMAALFREVQVWWFSNELAQLDSLSRRLMINELLQRSPSDASIISLALFGAISFPELGLSDIERMQAWFDADSRIPRSTRDALVLRVLTTWFAVNSPEILRSRLQAWIVSTVPNLVRAALVLSVGLVHQSVASHYAAVFDILDTMPDTLNFNNREIDLAVGWLLSKMWPVEPEMVQKWLAAHGSALTRRGFRIAVARMPNHIRQELADTWKLCRLGRGDRYIRSE